MKGGVIGALLVAALGVLCAAGATGEARAESDRERQEKAIATFERGREQFRAGRYDAAANLFKEAYETWEDPAYLYNIGFSFEKAQRWRLAITWYGRFLERYRQSPNAPEVERRLAAAEESRDATRAQIMITSEPAGARAVVLVGEEAGAGDEAPPSCITPCRLLVDPGPVAVAIELGERRVERSKGLAEGERWELSVELPGARRAREPDRTGSWIAWGIGGASLVIGVVFAAVAQGSYDEGTALAARSPLEIDEHRRLGALREDLEQQSLIADIGFSGALIGATVGTVLWLTAEPEREEPMERASWRR